MMEGMMAVYGGKKGARVILRPLPLNAALRGHSAEQHGVLRKATSGGFQQDAKLRGNASECKS